MPKIKQVVGLLFFLGISLLNAGAVDLDVPKEIPDEPFDIRANRMEYTNETMIASGGVTGRFENVTLRADQVSGNTKTGDLHMEGDIHFERGNILWQGSELDYNYVTDIGNFGPSSLDFDPVLMSVDQVERVSTNEYALQGATFTTCPKDHPHFHVRAKEATLVDEKYITAKGVTVYVGKMPVMYLPYWRQNLTKSVFSFKVGYGSQWGAYLLLNATIPLNKYFESSTDVNMYSKRGVGFAQGFAWDHPQAVGDFFAFYLNDQDPYARYDSASAQELISNDRYWFKFEHLQNFSDTQYINTKLNYLSDPAVIEEFFVNDYERFAQPESYLSWVYGNSYIGSEAFANQRLNTFYENTDRYQYSLDLYRTKIPGTPFYVESENSIADLERVFAETNSLFATTPSFGSVRTDSKNTITLPQRWGPLSLVPRASYRATYYTDTKSGDAELRQIPGAGMSVSLQATKVLSDKTRWYGKGLRHKIEPYVDYIYENSSLATNNLYVFDDIDLLHDENKVQIGLRNVLQTKRDNRVSRFIDLDLYTYYLVDNYETDQNFDSLFVNARMPLTKRTVVNMNGEIDWNNGDVPYFNSRISHDSDDVIFSLEHLYRPNRKQSLWTPRVDLYPDQKVSLEAYVRYNDRDDDVQEVASVIYMNWCCMRYGLGAHFYDEDEIRIMFSIGLSAFPEARMGTSF
jgi:lipopolysaccharide assembly outer membrane protein LptD (OstA)